VRKSVVLLVVLVAIGAWRPWERPATDPRTARVVRVLDGDTIQVAGLGTVRYIGIDTPELHHPRKPVQRLAAAAMRANAALVDGRVVRIEFDRERTDAHGRLLGYVFTGEVFVNAEMMRRGWARPLTIAPNTRHRALLAGLFRQARARRVGLWGAGEGGPPWGVP